jgi:hypothetical protein
MFELNESSRAVVAKARKQADARKLRAKASAAESEPFIDAAE